MDYLTCRQSLKFVRVGLMEMAPGCIALNQDDLSVGLAHMDVHKALILCF